MKKHLFNFLFSASIFYGVAQVPNYVPSNNLTGFWTFTGNANDQIGTNNGTVNGATLTTDRFGLPNSAYLFDGNDYIALNTTFFGGSTSVSQLSYSTWINMSTLPATSTAYTINCKEGFWRTIALGINDLGELSFGGSQPSGYFGISTNPTVLQPNVWYHIVVTFSSSTAKIFLNNVLINTVTMPISSLNYEFLAQGNSTATNFIGASYPVNPGITNYFKGVIDDFGIWLRELTPCEINDLYNSQLNSNSGISAGSDQSVCTGGSATLTASGGTNFSWNNNISDGVSFVPITTSNYIVTGMNMAGCFGIDTVTVFVNNPTYSTQVETALDSFTWPVNGQTYMQSGIYTDTLLNAEGCDSIITLDLTLSFTGIEQLQLNTPKKLVKITDLNGRETPFRKNTVLLFIFDDGTVERVVEVE